MTTARKEAAIQRLAEALWVAYSDPTLKNWPLTLARIAIEKGLIPAWKFRMGRLLEDTIPWDAVCAEEK